MSSDDRDRIRDAFHRVHSDHYWRPGLEDRVIATVSDRRGHDGRRGRRPLALATALAVVLAGLAVGTLLYASRMSRPQPEPGTRPLPYVSALPTTSPTVTPSPAASAVPVQTSPQACRSSQLSVQPGRPGVAAGNIGIMFTFQNRSGVTCTLYGFPGLQMLDAQGGQIPTSVNWGSDYIVRPETPALVTLRPGDQASFMLGYSQPANANLTCPATAQLAVTPPNQTQPLVIPFRLAPAESADGLHFQCGRFTVSPVYAGTGYQPGS